MSQPQRLDGINPLAYLGSNPYTPPGMHGQKRNPTPADNAGYNIGDFWLNLNTRNLYYLAAKQINAVQQGVWILLASGAPGDGIETLTGNTGGAVPGDLSLNINVVGIGPYVVSGVPGTNTLSITDNGTVPLIFRANDASTATASGNIINIGGLGGSHITSTASASTLVIKLNGFTNHALTVGNVTGSIDSLGVATNGQIPIGSTGSNPVLATITAGSGISVTNGAGSITIATVGSGLIAELQGDTGTASGSTVNVLATPTAGSSVSFEGDNASTLALKVTDLFGNTIIGESAGNPGLTSTNTVALGIQAGASLTNAENNVLIGPAVGSLLTSGGHNTILHGASGITTGHDNILLGERSGVNYASSESSNIMVGNTGVVGESNKMRIGTSGSGAGQVNSTFIGGINGVNVGSVASVVSINGDRLGTTNIIAGTGITVTPGPNSITIANAGGSGSYSEGTWTPVLSFVGQTVPPTYTVTAGTNLWTKIGNLVTVNFDIDMTDRGTAPSTGFLQFTGFPFPNVSSISSLPIRTTVLTGTFSQQGAFGLLSGTTLTNIGVPGFSGINGLSWGNYGAVPNGSARYTLTASYIVGF